HRWRSGYGWLKIDELPTQKERTAFARMMCFRVNDNEDLFQADGWVVDRHTAECAYIVRDF
ncbi:hypothetical protein, partial [Erwinia persicina]|uniref:hypothetical protein n=1 Tax=Erwinia persicina TaxID=55211 RepID=UPI001A9375C9